MLTTARNVRSCIASVAGVMLLAVLQPAHASTDNLAKNGSFEVNPPASGCAGPVTSIFAWNVTAGNIDIGSEACSDMPAAQGKFWVDLTGVSYPGTIERNLLTTVGKNYSLTFAFGGNPECTSDDTRIKAMNVLLNGVVVGKYSINVAGAARGDPQWQKGSIIFAATTSPTVLSFQSLNGIGVTSNTNCGPMLDNIRVVAIE
jgi:hypothetical protein